MQPPVQTPRIGAVMVVQNDAETVERSLASFYEGVEFLVVSTDPQRGWSGKPITPDNTLERIRVFDKDNKIEIIQGDFCRYPEPMRNDTFQRQTTVDRLVERVPGLDWAVQVDADEVFLDFADFKACVLAQPDAVRSVSWRWISLFNQLEDGRYLVIMNQNGEPHLEQFAIAHRPQFRLHSCRVPVLPERGGKPDPAAQYIAPPDIAYGRTVLHYSYAKSAARVWEKLQTWSHADEIDADAFFALWKRSKTDWESIRDFHPTYPIAWHALKPFSMEELKGMQNQQPSRPGLLRRAGRKLSRMLMNDI